MYVLDVFENMDNFTFSRKFLQLTKAVFCPADSEYFVIHRDV